MQVEARITSGAVIRRFQSMPEKLDQLVKLSVQDVSREAQRRLTGREGLSKYPRHGAGTPTPSPAGEPPAQVSTMLRKSVTIMPIRRVGFAHYTQTTMPTMAYAAAQEFGARIVTKAGKEIVLPARPFVKPAREDLVSSGRAREVYGRRILAYMRSNRG